MNYFNSYQPNNDDESDNEWIFSYADMMTLLLAFFVMMFSFSSLDVNKFLTVSTELSKTFHGKSEDVIIINENTNLTQKNNLKTETLDTGHITEGKLEIKPKSIQDSESKSETISVNASSDENGLSIINLLDEKLKVNDSKRTVDLLLPVSTYFDSGDYQIKNELKSQLYTIGKKVALAVDVDHIEIVGHTDSVLPGKYSPMPDNYTLSAARAASVALIFLDSGIKKEFISVTGVADAQPLYPEKNPDGSLNLENMKKNRRIHLIIHKRIQPDETSH